MKIIPRIYFLKIMQYQKIQILILLIKQTRQIDNLTRNNLFFTLYLTLISICVIMHNKSKVNIDNYIVQNVKYYY